MNTITFTDKFNKIEGITHTVEEVITITNGSYSGTLAHDNVNLKTLNVYSGSMLTEDRITNYTVSTPSETPWKNTIRIYASVPTVYISYETQGDTVEADDINNVQNAIVDTQNNLNSEMNRAELSENTIADNLNNEITRSTKAENEINNVINTNKPIWDDKYTKEEVLQKISDLINGSPQTLDTLNEIATALGNDPNFSTTIINLLGNKVDKVIGKQLSTEDYSTQEKAKLANVQENANNYIHPDTHSAAMIQEDESHMFVSAEEKAAINISGSDSVFETAGGTGNAIILTLPTLTNGLSKNFIASVNNGGTTATINGKPVYKPCTTTTPNFVKDKAYTIWYNLAGDCFFIKASAEGNTIASHVLAGDTFSNDSDTGLIGTMSDKGATVITPNTVNQAISLGYHNGNGYVLGDADLISANIKAGANIFNVAGKASVVDTAGANLAAGYMLVGANGYTNGSLISGSIPNYAGTWSYAQSVLAASGRLHMYPLKGYYDPAGGTGTYFDDANYIAANIVSGKSIFGLAGSAVTSKYKSFVGLIMSSVSGNIHMLNITAAAGFVPKAVYGYCSVNGYSSSTVRYFSAIIREDGLSGLNFWYSDSSTSTARKFVGSYSVPDFSNLTVMYDWQTGASSFNFYVWAYTW